ncbi:MAG: SPOR domain-containing protein [Rhodothermales bacterium]|nr:SPOR domain-containing protein [Rhodothermales bacterium]
MSVDRLFQHGLIRLATVVIALSVMGCSGSANISDRTPDRDLEYYIDHIDEYEDFDETSYVDLPPVATNEVEHDVPMELMTGSASDDSRTLETVQGFRIQIHSSLDKEGAVSAEERAKAWWQSIPAEGRPESMRQELLPVYLKYVQPYYRIRVGNFATREEAEIALELIAARFPRAFIAIDTVTVWR